jgi:hypothetical protein
MVAVRPLLAARLGNLGCPTSEVARTSEVGDAGRVRRVGVLLVDLRHAETMLQLGEGAVPADLVRQPDQGVDVVVGKDAG